MKSPIAWMLICGCFSCGSPPVSSEKGGSLFENMDRRTQLRLQSYMANGQRLYNAYCANCHQKNGRGLRNLIPPLRGLKYLQRQKEIACLIKFGASGPMIVKGTTYDAPMPAQLHLRDIQIAEIMSYIGNVWGNREGLIPVKQVSEYLDSCAISTAP